MMPLFDSIEFRTQAYHQEQPHGQHDFKHLGKQVDTIGSRKEVSGQANACQTNPNTHGRQNQGNEIELFGFDPPHHGQTQKCGAHQ
jgi:hypothetical protein